MRFFQFLYSIYNHLYAYKMAFLPQVTVRTSPIYFPSHSKKCKNKIRRIRNAR